MDTIGKIYTVISIVALVGMLIAFWFISKKFAKGVLLAVGVVLWIFGQAISSVPTREMKLISGLCAFAGFMGGLLGLCDLFRKKKSDANMASQSMPSKPPQIPPLSKSERPNQPPEPTR